MACKPKRWEDNRENDRKNLIRSPERKIKWEISDHKLRTRLCPQAQHFFVTELGRRLAYTTVRNMFRKITEGIEPNSARAHVRLHDLRHSFACRVLRRWQRSKRGAVGRVAVLSRYLGHERVTDTYWYLTATPELLGEAARQFAPPRP